MILNALEYDDAAKSIISACQKIDIYVNPKNKWRFKIAKNFQVR